MIKASILITLLGSCSAVLAASPTVEITSPPSGTVVHPGDTVAVSVAASGQKFLMMGLETQIPINNDEVLREPPYHFTVHIPKTISPGVYSLIASGATAVGQGEESPAVLLDVEMPDPPISIRTQPNYLIGIRAGEMTVLDGYGKYKNGLEYGLNRSKQISFVSLDPKVMTINQDGVVNAVGAGSTEIIVHVGELVMRVKAHVDKSGN